MADLDLTPEATQEVVQDPTAHARGEDTLLHIEDTIDLHQDTGHVAGLAHIIVDGTQEADHGLVVEDTMALYGVRTLLLSGLTEVNQGPVPVAEPHCV